MASQVYGFTIEMDGNAIRSISNLETRLVGLNRTAQNTVSGVSSEFAKLRNAIGGVVLGAGIVELGKKFMSFGMQMEQTKISLETLLRSKIAADSIFKSATQFAIKSPFTTADITKGIEMMANYGIETSKLMPSIKMLGDVSAGSTDKFNRLTYAFSQIYAGGLKGQELRQLVEAGFNPLMEISKMTGKSMNDLKKEMEQGKISFTMVEEAFRNATSEGGRFYNMMDAHSQTTTGLWSTFTDTVQLKSAEMFEEMKGGINGIIIKLTDLTKWLAANKATVMAVGKAVLIGVSAWALYRTSMAGVNAVTAIGSKNMVGLYRSMVMFQQGNVMGGMSQGLKAIGISMGGLVTAAALVGIGLAIKAFINWRAEVDNLAGSTERLKTSLGSGFASDLQTMKDIKSKAFIYNKGMSPENQRAYEEYVATEKTKLEESKNQLTADRAYLARQRDVIIKEYIKGRTVSDPSKGMWGTREMTYEEGKAMLEASWKTSHGTGIQDKETKAYAENMKLFDDATKKILTYEKGISGISKIQTIFPKKTNATSPITGGTTNTGIGQDISTLGGARGGLGEAKNINIRMDNALKIEMKGGSQQDIINKAPLTVETLIRLINNMVSSQSGVV